MATASRSYMARTEVESGHMVPTTPLRSIGVASGGAPEDDSPLPPPPVLSIGGGDEAMANGTGAISAAPLPPRMAPLVNSSRANGAPDVHAPVLSGSGSSKEGLSHMPSSSNAVGTGSGSSLAHGRREAPGSLAASFGASLPPTASSRNTLGSTMGLSSRSRTALRSASYGSPRAAEEDEVPVSRSAYRSTQRGSLLGQGSGSGSNLASASHADVERDGEEPQRAPSSRPTSKYADDHLAAERSPSPRVSTLHASTNGHLPTSRETEEAPPRAPIAEEPYPSRREPSEEPASRYSRRVSDEKVGHGGPSTSSRHALSSSVSHLDGDRALGARDSSSPAAAEVKARSVSAQVSSSSYQTPGITTRTLRSGAAIGTRSVLRLGRAAGAAHQPARRVAAYQDNEEEERSAMEEATARSHDGDENGSGEQAREGSEERQDGEGRGASQGRSSDGQGSAAGSEERRASRMEHLRGASSRAYSPHLLSHDLLERASLDPERRRSPPVAQAEQEPIPTVTLGADEEEEGDDVDLAMPPPPSRSEHHPNAARRAPAAANVKENEAPRATAGRPLSGGDPSALRARQPLSQWSGANANVQAQPQVAPPPKPQAAAEPMPATDLGPEHAESVEFFQRLRLEAIRQRESGVADAAPKPTKDLKEVSLKGFKFKKVSKAGQGGFSTVFRVRGPCAWPDGTPIAEEDQAFFAMKQVTLKRLEPHSRAEVVGEAELLSQLAKQPGNEKYILKYYCHRTSTQSLKILLELGDCDLTEVFKEGPLTRERLCDFWRQMLESVHFVHEKGGLVHTDLKPANFLMVGGRMKLIDFGIAQKIPLGTIHISRDGIVGTPNYMAPEACLAKEGKKYKAGKASDVWSLGCILYQMVYGRPPFDAIPQDRKLLTIMDPKHRIDFRPTRGLEGRGGAEGGATDANDANNEVDVWLQDCMRSALRHRAEERATIPELLCHPFSMSYHVALDRQTLGNMVCKLVKAGLTQGLSNEELQARVGIAFDNMLSDQSLVRSQMRTLAPPP